MPAKHFRISWRMVDEEEMKHLYLSVAVKCLCSLEFTYCKIQNFPCGNLIPSSVWIFGVLPVCTPYCNFDGANVFWECLTKIFIHKAIIWAQGYEAYCSKMNKEQHPPKIFPHATFFPLQSLFVKLLWISQIYYEKMLKNIILGIEFKSIIQVFL
jgi:hypothetical protein